MAVRFYDDALLKKFQKWIPEGQMTLLGVNDSKRLFEVVADKQNDKPLQLPILAISRNGGYSVLGKYKQPLSHNGSTIIYTNDYGVKLNAVPISISYQIDVYTRYLSEADEYARNLIFNIINYPKLQVEIPYENQGFMHDANIRINTEVEDNSDVPTRLAPGQFTRISIGIDIDDAYLFDVRIKDNLSIVSTSALAGNSTN
jgi:hypothetical protein